MLLSVLTRKETKGAVGATVRTPFSQPLQVRGEQPTSVFPRWSGEWVMVGF